MATFARVAGRVVDTRLAGAAVALSLLFALPMSCRAAEMFFAGEDAQTMSMLAVENAQAYSAGEALVPFWLMSAQKTTSPQNRRMVARHRLVALCSTARRELGSGQILTTTGRRVAYEVPGEPDKVLLDERFGTARPVDRKFAAAYAAADIACAHARYGESNESPEASSSTPR